ncbi:MAG: nicotinate phosphoribosyltransferase [Elusimicrobia bacterium]|nr:nicotinate phosphoribosyltransferase [Elusimicrobiota bacterium]
MTSRALLTDLYQLTMLQAYWRSALTREAVFELSVRALPRQRNFLMAAGLAQALDYLAGLRFSEADIAWLWETGLFGKEFVEHLEGLRFTGEVRALPEGAVFFSGEPVLRVTAPLEQAQLVETRLLNIIGFQSSVASKAARCVLAARGRGLAEFGLRRAHGGEAGIWAARASWLAGFTGTSAAEASRLYGIPVLGTMSHSFVLAHREEGEAFAAFARANPGRAAFLLDTYDVAAATERAVAAALELRARGGRLEAVRLDSGDLAGQARAVRRRLDAAGLREVRILASGDLDERSVRDLVAAGAPIDGFGIGTRLSTCADAPVLDAVYKLEEYAGQPRRKRSAGKATWPGRKQVWRRFEGGLMAGDVVALEGESAEGLPLLEPVMRKGRRLSGLPGLEESREHARRALESLPDALRGLEPARPYPVEISAGIRAAAARADAELERLQAVVR